MALGRWTALVAVAACGGGAASNPDATVAPLPDAMVACTQEAPATPTILAPAAGALDVTPAGMLLRGSPFSVPSTATHVASEFELWTVSGGGNLRAKVWSARIQGRPMLTEARFADGQLTDGISALEPWGRYGALVRYEARAGACAPTTSAASPHVIFRIDDGSTALFDPTQVRTVELRLSAETLAALEEQAVPPGCVPHRREYYPGSATIDGVRFDGVGVKTKGGCGSSRPLDEKAAFKIKLDWDDPAVAGCPEERRLAGQGTFTLNNMVQDGSLSHERLASQFYLAFGVPAQRAATVRLVVNDEYWGLYLAIESFSGRFAARHFANNDGMMYEAEYSCDLRAALILEDDAGCWQRELTLGPCDEEPGEDDDPQDFSLLRELVAALDALPDEGFYPAVTQLIDWDRFLAMWAADLALHHWDGYADGNNYRIYHDPSTDLWTLLPSGTDVSLTLRELRKDPFAVEARLIKRCAAIGACRAAMIDKLDAAILLFEAMDMQARRAAIRDQLRPFLEEDEARGPDIDLFDSAHRNTIRFIDDWPDTLRAFLD